MLCAGAFLLLEQVDGWRKNRGRLVCAVVTVCLGTEIVISKVFAVLYRNLEHLVDVLGLVPWNSASLYGSEETVGSEKRLYQTGACAYHTLSACPRMMRSMPKQIPIQGREKLLLWRMTQRPEWMRVSRVVSEI